MPLQLGGMAHNALINEAAQVCLDEREAYLAILTEGWNGYVCPNEGVTSESRALFRGTYHACQVWIERRGLAKALRYVLEHRERAPELFAPGVDARALLEILSRLD